MFQIKIITKTKGWWWKREKYNVYKVVRVTRPSDCGSYYFPTEYETISEHLDLEDADKLLQQLNKFKVN